jgi:hypothetical protein
MLSLCRHAERREIVIPDELLVIPDELLVIPDGRFVIPDLIRDPCLMPVPRAPWIAGRGPQ